MLNTLMKKIAISLLAGIVFFVACDKNNDSPTGIEGTWTVNRIIVSAYVNGKLTGSDTSTTGLITFNSDGTVTSVVETNDPETGTYTYDASSKQLNMISDGDTTTVTVTNLTANNLHFVHDESDEADDGTVYRFTADADYKR